jgi:hypothetical protein
MSGFIAELDDRTRDINKTPGEHALMPKKDFDRLRQDKRTQVKAGGVTQGEISAPFDAIGEQLRMARQNVRKRMQAGEGRNDTIKTLGLGDIPGSNLERKTLLGF